MTPPISISGFGPELSVLRLWLCNLYRVLALRRQLDLQSRLKFIRLKIIGTVCSLNARSLLCQEYWLILCNKVLSSSPYCMENIS